MPAKLTNEKIIKKFKEIHEDRYDYSKVDYTGISNPIIIICKEHGAFIQLPLSHLNGGNCPKCSLRYIDNDILKTQFKKVHGDRYDYSKVKYVDNKTLITIICKEHGEFEQSPHIHKNGSGCSYCSRRLLNTKDLIKDSIKIHGDRYDYSKLDYKGDNKKVIIICKEHGEFKQNPHNHKKGYNCPKCKKDYISEEKFINDCIRIHKNKFNYSKVKYRGTKEKIIIICPKHGEFEQLAGSHRKGFGCPKCSGYETSQEEVIKKFNEVHGDRYDYSKVIYRGSMIKVSIICNKHGEFKQTPYSHKEGKGCSHCAGKIVYKEDILKDCYKVHGNKYNYSKFHYINSRKKVLIICPIHGEFYQNINIHRNGGGCPKCALSGFKKNMSATLYYLRIEKEGKIVYKIGITNNNLKQRFGKDMKYITVIREWYYDDGEECYNQEQKILKEFSFAKFKGDSIFKDGNTEMFDRDILLLDN